MHFVTIWSYAPEHRDAVTERFIETGAKPPAGVTMVARWHDIAGGRGVAICETDDPLAVTRWCRAWNDMLEFEIIPVISDEQLASVLAG